MNFRNCKEALARGKRARRKSWRDSGQYISSFHRGRRWGSSPEKECEVYRIGDSKNIIEWRNRDYDLLQSDWEIMPKPDYAAFGRAVFADINDKQPNKRELELLVEHGMAHHVRYNPDVHGAMYASDCDMVWYLEG